MRHKGIKVSEIMKHTNYMKIFAHEMRNSPQLWKGTYWELMEHEFIQWNYHP